MKVIAVINQEEFMVEISKDEIAHIAGYPSAVHMGSKTGIGVNSVINVSKLWRALSVSRERKEDITNLSMQLQKIAGRLEYLNQALAEPIIEAQ